jgi:hypothetical protein
MNGEVQIPPEDASGLSARDRELLAAFVAELRPAAASQPSSVGTALVALLLVCAGVGAYRWLNTHHPGAAAQLSHVDVGQLHQLSLDGAASTSWQISGATATRVEIGGVPGARVNVDLPISRADCPAIAVALGVPSTCRDGTLAAATPLTLEWRDPAELDVASHDPAQPRLHSARVQLGLRQSGPRWQVSVGVRTSEPTKADAVPVLCLEQPLGTNELTIRRGARATHTSFSAASPTAGCGQGIRLEIGPPRAGATAAITIGAVEQLWFDATGTDASLEGATGHITLHPGGAQDIKVPNTITMGAKTLTAALRLERNESSLTLRADSATSVYTDDGQQLLTAWDREQWIVIPATLFVLTTVVLPPLIRFAHDGPAEIAAWCAGRRKRRRCRTGSV